MSTQPPIPDAVEIIAKRLYWVSLDAVPKRVPDNVHVFSTDRDLVYEPFSADFGPLNLGMVYRYCRTVSAKLNDPALADHTLIHYCSRDFSKRSNAAFLVAAYLVIVRDQSAAVASRKFSAIHPALTPYRDASAGPCSFQLSLFDCLCGLEKAIKLGWFSMKTFDLQSYEFHEKLENGDLTWIVPNKFAAFAGPSPTSIDVEGYPASTPEDFISYFKSAGISTVYRLNKPRGESGRPVLCRRLLSPEIPHR
jgi:cell division cycle 14